MTPRQLIIDCDPGVDDAIALLLAFASPELQLLGITTVAGNVALEWTQRNARRICELARRAYIPVYAGCPRPLLRSLVTAELVHGETGLDGAELPAPQMPLQPQHGVDFLIETLLSVREPITIAALAPLTNLAIALIKEPRIASKIAELVLMGGAITHGNVTPSAEFNIYVDPHAAHVVFSSGMPLTMISLDITHQVLTTPERLRAIRAINTPVSEVAADLLARYGMAELDRFEGVGRPLHDPCVIAYLVQPTLFTSNPFYVDVETTGEATLGRTVVDKARVSDREPNVNVVETVDADGVYRLLLERLTRL